MARLGPTTDARVLVATMLVVLSLTAPVALALTAGSTIDLGDLASGPSDTAKTGWEVHTNSSDVQGWNVTEFTDDATHVYILNADGTQVLEKKSIPGGQSYVVIDNGSTLTDDTTYRLAVDADGSSYSMGYDGSVVYPENSSDFDVTAGLDYNNDGTTSGEVYGITAATALKSGSTPTPTPTATATATATATSTATATASPTATATPIPAAERTCNDWNDGLEAGQERQFRDMVLCPLQQSIGGGFLALLFFGATFIGMYVVQDSFIMPLTVGLLVGGAVFAETSRVFNQTASAAMLIALGAIPVLFYIRYRL